MLSRRASKRLHQDGRIPLDAHPLSSEQRQATCIRAETLWFELAAIPLTRRRLGMVLARYKQSVWILVSKIRDAPGRKHLLVWWMSALMRCDVRSRRSGRDRPTPQSVS
jgi:hypothetical protein